MSTINPHLSNLASLDHIKLAHDKVQIRTEIRKQRSLLSNKSQHKAAIELVSQLTNLVNVRTANTIALYLANDGELDPSQFIKWCWQQGKRVVLPVLHPFTPGHLLFLQYTPSTLMLSNRFGIPEPRLDVTKVVPVSSIDIIFTPLVAFDKDGHRLGMGGGFYDRTLACLDRCPSKQPIQSAAPQTTITQTKAVPANAQLAIESKTRKENKLIGLAHDCQQVPQIPIEPWDIPLPMIVTPSQIIRAKC
ncbi:5-formyltetrahydrofolate cyclo-ligase [Thalassotalea euphylliae]|uniref:5-formyltetrahydrofolate cyclo-ligase n=1 Tax=Thalassotalea euphylliae TaxID=1655234 RepID=UPI001FE48EA1|nr:5-formyltetrahydrofolate cyclo-ligase [Thalassotalea euphylliae]